MPKGHFLKWWLGSSALLTVAACSHHQPQPATSSHLKNADRVVLSDSTRLSTKLVQQSPDGTISITTYDGKEVSTTFSEIREVHITDHGQGALEGALIGFDDDASESGLEVVDEGVEIGVVVGFGVLFSIPFAIIGGLSGSSDIYKNRAQQVEVRPTAGGAQASWGFRF